MTTNLTHIIYNLRIHVTRLQKSQELAEFIVFVWQSWPILLYYCIIVVINSVLMATYSVTHLSANLPTAVTSDKNMK